VKGERRQIGRRQRLVLLLRGDPPERAEAIAPRRGRGLARDVDAPRIADADALDTAASVDEHADAPADGVRGLGQLAREVVGDDVVRVDPPAVEALEAVLFGWRKTENVAVKV